MAWIGKEQLIADIKVMMDYLDTAALRNAYILMRAELSKEKEKFQQYQSQLKMADELRQKRDNQLNQFFV